MRESEREKARKRERERGRRRNYENIGKRLAKEEVYATVSYV